MKNKKTFIISLVVIFLISFICVITKIPKTSPDIQTAKQTDDAINVNETLVKEYYSNVKTEFVSEFETFAEEYKDENLTFENYCAIEAYILFILEYSPADEDLNIIHSLLKEGHTIQVLTSIYDFYLTTNEDEGIIAQIASLEDTHWGDHWIENAYNEITDCKHGVLDSDEIKMYIANGLSSDDISYANILSRRGVYTIDEILEMKQSGKSWTDINNSVYLSYDESEKLQKNRTYENILNFVMESKECFDETPLLTYELSKTISKIPNDVLSDKVSPENIGNAYAQIEEIMGKELVSSTRSTMEMLGLPPVYMSGFEYRKYEKENYEKALISGLNDKTIDSLKKRGFSMAEIADAAPEFDGNSLHLLNELKRRREA